MNCNHEKFLEEQELQCRRIARSCNEGTEGQREWLKTAETLLARRREHIAVCKKCSKGKQ
jgi:hypothetical protein